MIIILDPSPAGQLSHEDVRLKINEIINEMNAGAFSFFYASTERIPLAGDISSDLTAPTYVNGLTEIAQVGGFELVTTGPWANTGAILNNTGETVTMIGSFDFHPQNQGSLSTLNIWSEQSSDGGNTFTENDFSARSYDIATSAESTQTKSARIVDWPSGSMNRFAMYNGGGGGLHFEPPSFDANSGGNVVSGLSFIIALARTS